MRTWVLILVLACGGKQEPAKPLANTASPMARPAVASDPALTRPTCEGSGACAVKYIEYFAAATCACKDKACAERVLDEYTTWGSEMARTAKADDASDANPEQTKQMTDAASRFTECYTKLAMDAAGSGAP